MATVRFPLYLFLHPLEMVGVPRIELGLHPYQGCVLTFILCSYMDSHARIALAIMPHLLLTRRTRNLRHNYLHERWRALKVTLLRSWLNRPAYYFCTKNPFNSLTTYLGHIGGSWRSWTDDPRVAVYCLTNLAKEPNGTSTRTRTQINSFGDCCLSFGRYWYMVVTDRIELPTPRFSV